MQRFVPWRVARSQAAALTALLTGSTHASSGSALGLDNCSSPSAFWDFRQTASSAQGIPSSHLRLISTSTPHHTPAAAAGEPAPAETAKEPQTLLSLSASCPPVSSQANITTSEMQASASGGYSTGVTTQPSGQGFKKTFYKRKLPSPPSIAFASTEGRQLFAEALAAGHMNGFFKLMEQFSTQDEPSFCGLASLAMVLNALAIDPRRTWKGAWRWFHEQMLDCCRPLEDVKRDGITLPQAACLARCNGARVELHRYGGFTLDQFRQEVLETCASGEQHLVVSYSRRTFLQTGDGHFSPIGGYHKEKDLVLILDVARFKYPPHWVPLPMLYEAMQYVDPVTQLPRGYLRMTAQPLLSSVLLTLDVRSSCWQQASDWVRRVAPGALQQAAQQHPAPATEQVLDQLLAALPPTSLDAFVMVRQNYLTQGSASTSAGGGTSLSVTASSGAAAAAGVDGAAAATSSTGVVSVEGGGCTPGHVCNPAPVSGSNGGGSSERCTPVQARQQVLRELRALPLYLMVRESMQRSGELDACTQIECKHRDTAEQPQPTAGAAPAQQTDEPTQHHTSSGCCQAPADQRLLRSDSSTSLDSLPEQATAGVPEQATPHGPAPGVRHTHRGAQKLNSGFLAEKATMLLLLLRREGGWPQQWSDPVAGKTWEVLTDLTGMSIVDAELAFLREQWRHVDEVVESGAADSKCSTGCDQPLDCAALNCTS